MWMSLPSNLKTVVNLAPQRRWALAAMDSNTDWASVGELEITRRISLVAVCCSSESARAFSRASTLASSAAFVICVMDTPCVRGPGAASSRQLPHLHLHLLQPVRHTHLAVQRRRGPEVFSGLLALAGAPVELAEAEVAVGDEGAHAEFAGKCQRLIVAGVSRLHLKGFAMRGDLAEEIEDPRFDAALCTLPGQLQHARGTCTCISVSTRQQVRLDEICPQYHLDSPVAAVGMLDCLLKER